MSKSRLEAFTDGVIAIVITIMVLELKVPKEPTFSALMESRYHFLVYLVSFLTLAIYWNNHHHLLQIARRISGRVLWCNIVLLFFLSLFPFTTAWVDEHLTSRTPELLYGGVMLVADIIWLLLAQELVRENGKGSAIHEALKDSKKSYITIGLILAGLIAGVFWPPAVMIMCVLSMLPWIIPDKKIEKHIRETLLEKERFETSKNIPE
ncbi:MAG: TMEM175 family protein [Clostridiales Family XIII bacterium]|jgi:uncharacterized membrane protein|nr:TMEM175 family protein [Clostridiales Family XIII bacterium]